MSAAERISFIQARLDQAMPGPWEFDGLTVSQAADNYAEVIPTDVNCSSYCYGGSVRGPDKGDAEFIANAPSDIAFLLDLARKQQAAIDAVADLASRWDARGAHDMLFSKTIPDEEIAIAILTDGAEKVEAARMIRNALDTKP